MKTSLFVYFVILSIAWINVVFGAGASSFNGVTIGKSLKPTTNHNPLMTYRYGADPGVIVYNDRVYVYTTNDGDVNLNNKNVASNDYSHIQSINVISSADLVNWTDHGSIQVAGYNGAAKWAQYSWAPCATYKKINGQVKFFLYFANNANGIGVLTSDSPTGPWKDPIGQALITRNTPNCNVEWLFDPAVFIDDDGKGYLYFGGGVPSGQDAHPKTIRVVQLGSDMTSLAGTPQLIDAPYVFEDSGINKIGNTYIYSYCTNWTDSPYGGANIAFMTSSSPMGPFTAQRSCFKNPGEYIGNYGNNHHMMVEFKGKYYIFYHTEWLNKQVFGDQKGYRTAHVDEMPIQNGVFGMGTGTLTGVQQLENVDGTQLNLAASFAWQSGIKIKGEGDVTTVEVPRGGWTGVSQVDLGNASSITIKASSSSGATIKVCTGSENGNVLGYVEIPSGGSLQEVSASISNASGTKDLFFVASNSVSFVSWQLKSSNATSSGGNNNGGGIGGWNWNWNNNNNESCWATSQGYKCCSQCGEVFYVDESGKWGIENNEWCGLLTSCNNSQNNSQRCQGAQGYPCCTNTCFSYMEDGDGRWGVENGDWCLINKNIC